MTKAEIEVDTETQSMIILGWGGIFRRRSSPDRPLILIQQIVIRTGYI